jgi:hypothetical protein
MSKKIPSLRILQDALDYCPATGAITWRERPVSHFVDGKKYSAAFIALRWNRKYAGKPAGNYDPKAGYVRIGIDYATFLAHRLAWLLAYGEQPNGPVDHIDGDGLNNRLANLRVVTAQQNQQNQAKRADNKSGFTGVFYRSDRAKWMASIRVNGSSKNIGHFASVQEAAAARQQAEVLHGFHENHGRARSSQRQRKRT